MDFKEFWDGPKISTETVNEIMRKRLAQASGGVSDMDFYRSCFDQINEEIDKMESTGKAVCYPNYTILRFYVSDSSVVYHNLSLKCDDTVVAAARNILEHIMDEHAYLCATYQGYDDFKDLFNELRPRIMLLGGKLTFKRPCFTVSLPDDRDALTYSSYDLHGCERDYEALKRRICYLNNNEPASASITTD